ncbi:hypothetical protein HQ45_07090 [Porphyromonas crevioricanis]|uniref:DUF3307 domain-containing protein n=3 Tax=Porphyromonas crevioricanis TaxID=393921 RepID=A0AB34PGH4_9PORP|nr:DUF3307 domain-containing protein [Porphyromonas crevioricanis]KGN89735.1 hypothetical protein HQ45_07090 [Porphyromonas crevioricanis]KGN93730.1 hypothetical protein HQ38_08065 [Porphyromonas crevioricanis]GAD04448.1 hypothetical protein PORCRE_132 [Porphyromonas crevioricanis JCM 15906]GAD07033.1 hypothetical protein PORCAN_646 [Porphyromonas crevioricanis JCM 13913]
MNMIVLLRLLFAHVLADFALQSDKLSKGKSAGGRKGFDYLLLHSFIHAVLAYLFVAQWTNYLLPLIIFFTHFGMDWFKATKMRQTITAFLLDQVVHVAVILVLWLVFFAEGFTLSQLPMEWNTPKVWLIAIAYLLVLQPSSILLGLFIAKWTPQELKDKSLPNAGKWIGYLERLLILTFILTESIEGVGFLLAAKSIFRFGELNKAREIRTTEYVLIGTLVSFGIAIMLGSAVLMLQ